MEKKRHGFSSSIGFILASAGAAVGLGNIWKFPYLAGSSGGGIFLIVYIVACLLVGIPILISEHSIGRHGQGDAYRSFTVIAKERGSKHTRAWGVCGFIGILTAFVMYTYYVVVGGWVVNYFVKSITTPLTTLDSGVFAAMISDPWEPLIFTIIFTLLTFAIVFSGVQSGIEKAAKTMMPLLFILLIVICAFVLTLPGSSEGLKYLFLPNTENMRSAGGFGKVALSAMCQAFWSLSLAEGIMVIFGSYQPKSAKLVSNAVWVAVLDLCVAMLAGTSILGAVFAFGQEPTAGTGLLFGTLPMVFGAMGAVGKVIAIVFFFCVILAALTSAISLLEVMTSFLSESCHIERRKALVFAALVAFCFSLLASLSNGVLSGVSIGGMNIFDALGYLAETLLLPISSLIIVIFVGWIWKPQNALQEITNEGTLPFKLSGAWSFLIKYIIPLGIVYIFVSGVM